MREKRSINISGQRTFLQHILLQGQPKLHLNVKIKQVGLPGELIQARIGCSQNWGLAGPWEDLSVGERLTVVGGSSVVSHRRPFYPYFPLNRFHRLEKGFQVLFACHVPHRQQK